MIMPIIAVVLLLSYFTVALALYGLALVAARYTRMPAVKAGGDTVSVQAPVFYIVAPCRDGAADIPEFVESLRRQTYPAERMRLLILADNCIDPSSAVARSLGVEVFERHNLDQVGKGYALNDLLRRRLKAEAFDVLVLFDIDARVEPSFLGMLARHFQNGQDAVQGSSRSKNPDETPLTRLGDFIQDLIRLHQKGRSALGLQPLPMGSHGIALSRMALDRLDWTISTGRTADDLELALRCCLVDIAMRFAPELRVTNDLPAQAHAIRKQRRRWTANSLEVIPKYMGPFLAKAWRGDWKSLEAFVSLACLPSFANLFIGLGLSTLFLVSVSCAQPRFIPYAAAAAVLWFCDGLYFVAVFWSSDKRFHWRDTQSVLTYIGVRAVALFESLIFFRSKEWSPTLHKGEK